MSIDDRNLPREADRDALPVQDLARNEVEAATASEVKGGADAPAATGKVAFAPFNISKSVDTASAN